MEQQAAVFGLADEQTPPSLRAQRENAVRFGHDAQAESDYHSSLFWRRFFVDHSRPVRVREEALIGDAPKAEIMLFRCEEGHLAEDIVHGFEGRNRRLNCFCGKEFVY